MEEGMSVSMTLVSSSFLEYVTVVSDLYSDVRDFILFKR